MLENIEMLHDGGQRNRERLGDLADGDSILLGEPRQNGPAGRVGQSREGRVQCLMPIVNHMVMYMRPMRCVKGELRGCAQTANLLRNNALAVR